MDLEAKKKHRRGKKKIKPTESNNDDKSNNRKISKKREISFQNEIGQKRISLHSSNFIPTQVREEDYFKTLGNFSKKKEDNYYEIITKDRKEIKKLDDIIDEQYNNKNNIFEFLKLIEESINYENMKCIKRIDEIPKEKEKIEILKNVLKESQKQLDKSETEKNVTKKILENKDTTKRQTIILTQQKIEKGKSDLHDKNNLNKKLKEKIPERIENISK